MSEKQITVSSDESSTGSLPREGGNESNVDIVLTYVKIVGVGGRHIGEKSLIRKIDWRIVPIMFACYTMQFIDKVLINYAAVMGLPKDLKLQGNQFTWAATSFFIAYLVAEIPTGYLLQKIPAGKYLGANVILWGIATGCTAAANNFTSLVAARVFLGVFEAAIAPSLTIITGMWYTTSEQPPRFGLWYCGLGLGQLVGGIVSYGFQHVKGESLEGWRVMFIVLGIVTVVVGAVTLLLLPDTPMTASFLTEEEKVVAINRIGGNQTGIGNRSFKWSQIKELAMDMQIYLMILVTILCSVSSGVITTYSATLIRNFGYTPPIAALLNMPSGVVSITVTILSGIAVGKASNRWLWITGLAIPGALGGGLMSFLPNSNRGGLLAGIYLVNSIVAVLVITFNWLSANVAGHTKRTVSMSLVSGAFSIGNIIGPQTFQAKDAPNFYPAKIAVLATQAGAALVAIILRVYYRWQNSKKEKRSAVTQNLPQDFMWLNLTDKENPNFRYVY
ncbi:MFS general substrate transporter [Choiromyces venosus 120613-1]|uniref:MFS general substrate transporter n=1 Tax=Choiromyces venosus 120613-1 TaxID=1336337 RepID=A0A3N4JHE2_9PEZI|nr:MFS general substrate transporter [Choiromyces venosus 120613-1]